MSLSSSQVTIRPSYHHGDLRQALLRAAKQLIAEAGIENLSLRKLAERAGVSRTAPYHHFSDKNDLLCAIAAEGFRRRHQKVEVRSPGLKRPEYPLILLLGGCTSQ